MPTFAYEAVDSAGRPKKGTVDASNENEAREKLKSQGQFPTSISQKGKKAAAGGKKAAGAAAAAAPERKRAAAIGKVSSKDLTLFTRQFSTLIEAGLPMVRALDILENMLRPGAMKNAVMDIRDDVEGGSSLSEAMGKCPKAFDELYISMIRAGEAAGLLGKILNRLADFMEKSQKLKRQIIGALIYPAAVITIAGIILTLIIMFIVPTFQKMFTEMKVELPMMTQMLMSFADIIINYWYIVIFTPVFVFLFFFILCKTKGGKYAVDMASLYLPVFGVIIKKSSVSRFCRTLGELSNAGVPILDALGILRTAIGNMIVAEAVEDVHASIREGESIAEPMRRSGVFDIMVVNMVEVGEETGELDKMLIKVADTYDSEVDTLVGGLMSLLEPILIIGMGLAVGFIVISLFMPLIGIITALQSQS